MRSDGAPRGAKGAERVHALGRRRAQLHDLRHPHLERIHHRRTDPGAQGAHVLLADTVGVHTAEGGGEGGAGELRRFLEAYSNLQRADVLSTLRVGVVLMVARLVFSLIYNIPIAPNACKSMDVNAERVSYATVDDKLHVQKYNTLMIRMFAMAWMARVRWPAHTQRDAAHEHPVRPLLHPGDVHPV